MLVAVYSMMSASYGRDSVPEIFTLFGFFYFFRIGIRLVFWPIPGSRASPVLWM